LYLGFYIGDLGGPVIGGFLAQRLGFKWIFWFLGSIGCVLLLTIFFFLPETFRHNDIPQPSSIKPPRTSLKEAFKKANPLTPLKLLLLPNVALESIYMSSILAFMFVQNIIIPKFDTIYNLSLSAIGLIYLAPGVGYLIGSIVGGRYSDYVLVKYESKHNGYSYPEIRLKSIWFGSMLLPVSYYAFGWMIEFKVNLILPIIFMFLGKVFSLFLF
jgi:predicted MFS family arabinose efflux permease